MGSTIQQPKDLEQPEHWDLQFSQAELTPGVNIPYDGVPFILRDRGTLCICYVTWDGASDDKMIKVCCSANRSTMAKHGDSLKCVSRFAFYVSHFAFHVPETKNAFQPSFCFLHSSTVLHSCYLKYGKPKKPANDRNQRAVPEKPTRGRALGRSMYTGQSLTLVVTVTAYIL